MSATGNIGGIVVSAEITHEDGTHRNVIFPIYPSDEILIAMLDHRRIAYEEKWAGAGEAQNLTGIG